ncbi:MAG: hypothetical protein EOO99_04065 [Pedobacter sp.]|nr:MAG: hypothetical protein EOO99_04065 [Pedobacter sp.]
MKKIIYSLFVILSLGFSSTAFANEDKKPKTELSAADQAKLNRIIERVETIRKMDKSTLTKQERKELRKELKEMKAQANGLSQGVYLSVGAIIIIILLLILIL